MIMVRYVVLLTISTFVIPTRTVLGNPHRRQIPALGIGVSSLPDRVPEMRDRAGQIPQGRKTNASRFARLVFTALDDPAAADKSGLPATGRRVP